VSIPMLRSLWLLPLRVMTSAWWTMAVDHCCGDDLVAEDVAPAGEGQVAGQDQRGVFVAGGDELVEQVGCVLLEGNVADFVDLCGNPHRSIYAEPATMPRAVLEVLLSGCDAGRSLVGDVLVSA